MIRPIRVVGWLIASGGLAALLTAGGCGDVPVVGNELLCDLTPFEPNQDCAKQSEADAGTDTDADVTDAANAINDPGLDTSSWVAPDSCKTGHCLPAPIGNEAGLWSIEPISLWIGPADQVLDACPDDPKSGVPNEKFRLFDNLVAPPATCSTCTCAPSEGSCNGVPETLELRAGACGQNGVITVPFDTPANWDGSCTNADTIAAGAKCPAGSSTLCTQSVHSSALPLPVNDACKASASAPSLDLKTSWEIAALACHGNVEGQSCGKDALKMYCVNDPGPPWLQCTFREGVHEKCPDNYQYARHVLYPKDPIDNRGCSSCACGAPTDSACLGGLRLSTGGACGTDLVTVQVGSMGPICYDFLAPGLAIGSKAIVNRTYLPGMCSASGGEAVGDANADVVNAVTFCCLEPYVEAEPPH